MATVSLEHVTKTYRARGGDITAANDLNLDIEDGACLALVGPSGCGKTTTLRVIAGLERVTCGTIHIGGKPVNDVLPKDRNVAMVFQNYALYPHMTVFNNMAFGLRMRRVRRAEIKRKVTDIADMLGIGHLLDRKPASLSGGQQQRVAVGRAVVRNPSVYLFDEPLSNLDAQMRRHLRTELKRLRSVLATTAVYVTHDQEEAIALGDRIAVMHHGAIRQCDTPDVLYHRPADRFVAGFIGMPPMNFLDGRIRIDDNVATVETDACAIPIPATSPHRFARYEGQRVVLGIRPDAVALLPVAENARTIPGMTHAPTIGGTVDVVDAHPQHHDVHIRTRQGASVVVRTPPGDPIPIGSAVRMALDATRVHVFEPGATGRRIGT